MSMTDETSPRFDELVNFTCAQLNDAAKRIHPDVYLQLIKHLHIQTPGEFETKFIANLVNGARKELVADANSSHLRIPRSLNEVDAAVARAQARRTRVLRGETLRPEEQPANLYKYTVADLTDCQLRVGRRQWLEEIRERKRVVEQHLVALRHERDLKRELAREKIQDVGIRITAFSNLYKDMQSTGEGQQLQAKTARGTATSRDDGVVICGSVESAASVKTELSRSDQEYIDEHNPTPSSGQSAKPDKNRA